MTKAIGRNEVIVIMGLLIVAAAVYFLAGAAWALMYTGLVLVVVGIVAEFAASRG